MPKAAKKTAKKSAAKKKPAKKAAAKKAVRKVVAKKAVRKAAVKKAARKAVRKAVVKKAVRRAVVKKAVRRAVVKKAVRKKLASDASSILGHAANLIGLRVRTYRLIRRGRRRSASPDQLVRVLRFELARVEPMGRPHAGAPPALSIWPSLSSTFERLQ